MILENAKDIIFSSGMQYKRTQKQHGKLSCFEHSINVVYVSILMASTLNIRINIRSLIRGALLHDYFLYDWREQQNGRRRHGFKHAQIALRDASQHFPLNKIEKNIIERHMFPLNITPPKYRESILVCLADKLCAGLEFSSTILPVSAPGEKIRRYFS